MNPDLPVKSFRQVLYGAAKRLGMVPEQDGLDRSAAGKLTEFINSAVKLAWEFYSWPDVFQWRAEEIIAHPTLTGARYVPRVNAERTLKVTLEIWDDDPRVSDTASQIGARVESDGIYFPSSYPKNKVWVKFKSAPPEFSDTEWSALQSYAVGALVWDPGDGHVYRARLNVPAGTPTSSATHWTLVPVPDCLAEPVKAGVIGAWHAAEGQHGTARVKEEYMLELLEHEILQLENQGQMTRTHH